MMKLKSFLLLPLSLLASSVQANEVQTQSNNGTTFHFSTEVQRTVEKDLMQVTIFSRQTGKSLPALKKAVSADLNKVLALAKQSNDIDVQADGVSNYLDYSSKNKPQNWVAEGRIYLESKNVEAMANILDNLGERVAVESIHFRVSPEKMALLEDEMTLDIIKQFQHKATVIQKGLKAKRFNISNINLETPNGEPHYYAPMAAMATMEKSAMANESMPIEAGKTRISARASGEVTFE